MGDSIYNYVHQFNKYKSDYDGLQKDRSSESLYTCSSMDGEYSNFDKDKCIYSMKYFKKIEEKKNVNNYLVGGCKYLNYKLCDIVDDKRYKYNSLTLFEKLRTENQSYFDEEDICNGHIQNLSEDIINKVKKLIELYDNFNNIKSVTSLNGSINCGKAKECDVSYMSYEKSCKSQDDQEFCSELETFRGRYNDLMSSVEICTDVKKILPSFRSNNVNVILLIPMVIILIILFILYKFSPFRSWLRNKIWRKMRMLDNIAQSNNQLLHYHDATMKTPIKTKYNISYHSELNS